MKTLCVLWEMMTIALKNNKKETLMILVDFYVIQIMAERRVFNKLPFSDTIKNLIKEELRVQCGDNEELFLRLTQGA